jgi:pilus assembly protein Flp/PilA
VVIMRGNIQRFLQDCRAVSAIEYALLGGLIAVVIVIGVSLVGTQVASLFEFVKTQVKQATS